MFELGLKIRQWWSNIKLRKNRENTAHQVHETNVFAMAFGLFLKTLVLVTLSLVILFPFFFMFMISFMGKQQALELSSNFSLIPQEFSPDNYTKAMGIYAAGDDVESLKKGVDYLPSLGFTFANVVFSVVVKILVTMLAGYAFSLKTWRFKKLLWSILISLLVLPEVALLSGQYWMVTRLDEAIKLKQDFLGMVAAVSVPFLASIFTALMFRNAFEAIPKRLKEVATVDGAVGAKYFFKIAVPMVTPTILTVTILTALASWNSYLWPALISDNTFTVLSVWIFSVGQDLSDPANPRPMPSLKMAAAILAIAPMFIVYLLARKWIMRSISRQGSTIKG
ncbi:carbohydrate ABC transporter permease [Mycoplasmopsis gallinarum]|uniref:carbohydrate ABC transporter permease n=1 Tax=Mycoplasmopsis gallinarum TaxID=29557 RepID=UPI000480C771|nr:carbohydrate ABC transporter permease [Mycoplasmopsis gallinarum]